MGIDIRHGPQLECIQCALCIDACDEIMGKIGRPQKLIAYDTYRSLELEAKGGGLQLRLIRPRTMLYAALLSIAGVVTLLGSLNRTMLSLNAVADRNPFFTVLSDGSVRNTFTVRILNKLYSTHTFTLGIEGIEGAKISALGHESESAPKIDVKADSVGEVRVGLPCRPRRWLGCPATSPISPLPCAMTRTAAKPSAPLPSANPAEVNAFQEIRNEEDSCSRGQRLHRVDRRRRGRSDCLTSR